MKLPNVGVLKPYPEMKDTGVEWLGKVPEHWELPRLGAILQERGEVNSNGKVVKVLSVLRDRGVIPYSEKGNIGNKMSEDITRYKVVRPDDIVVNCMNVIIGSVGLSPYTGCLSPVYYVLKRRLKDDDPRYLNAFFQTKPFQESLVRIGNGILSHRMRIPMELLKCEPFPKPPTEEQTAIVRFLDHADRRIRRYIRAKQKLIGLLEEQKQAVIHQAVTGQIDVRTGLPYPTYKSLGVEWLREVPEHWGGISLGAAADSVQTGPFGSQLHASDYVSGGIPVINPSHMRNSSIEPDPSISISQKKAEELSRHELKPGDIVMARRGEMGRCALVTEIEAGWLCGTGSLRIRPRSGIFVPAYLLLVLNAPGVRDTLSLSSIGATMDNLNAGMVSRLMLPELPFPEQIAIVNFVDKWRTNKDNALDCSRRQIDLLNEYRTRLIADAVTGKLDVREASAELPEEDLSGDAEESAEEQGIKK